MGEEDDKKEVKLLQFLIYVTWIVAFPLLK